MIRWRRFTRIMLLNALLSFVAAFNFAGCKHSGAQRSQQKTDLGVSNRDVSRRFKKYLAKPVHCVYERDADYRVILAGFGPFSGKASNISSLVAMNFVSFMNDIATQVRVPSIGPQDHDGAVESGIVSLSGKKVAVCAVNASVIWDLAGAIFLHEASIFKPDLIIMSGMDGEHPRMATWEHHAVNIANSMNGFESDGSESDVSPVVSRTANGVPILAGGPDELKMTWNGDELVKATRSIVQKISPEFSVTTGMDETPGDYLCNNVSYVVLAGLSGLTLDLAGGEIVLSTPGLSKTKAGFLHYPWNSPQGRDEVKGWTDVLAAAIASEMSR